MSKFDAWFAGIGGRFTSGEKRELKFWAREAFNFGKNTKHARFGDYITTDAAIRHLPETALAAIHPTLSDAFHAGRMA